MFANLCQTNVYVYDTQYRSWHVFPLGLSLTPLDVSIMSVYLLHPIDRYDVVSSVKKTSDDLQSPYHEPKIAASVNFPKEKIPHKEGQICVN